MRKSFIFLCFLFVLFVLSNCTIQKTNTIKEPVKSNIKINYIKYITLIDEAINLYEMKSYKESALKYEEAFKVVNAKADMKDRYNASCSFALSNNLDKAFYHLFLIANEVKYTNLTNLKNDTNLITLHNDKRWRELLDIVKENNKKIEKYFDKKLIDKLDTIYHDDQHCRSKLGFVLNKYGIDSDEFIDIQNKCKHLDSINQIKVSNILDNNGWLGKDIVGDRGNLTLFLVLQHSDNNINMQLKYLPLLEEAVKKGKADPMHLAMLEDRTRVNQGKRQIYGSQIHTDKETGEMYVAPLIDPENVNKRRTEVGLGKLEDYVGHWNLVWDVKKHIERTAKIEAEKKTNKE